MKESYPATQSNISEDVNLHVLSSSQQKQEHNNSNYIRVQEAGQHRTVSALDIHVSLHHDIIYEIDQQDTTV